MQVSFVGGEPLVRHKELSRILPVLSDWGIYSLVVTSAVIPFPTAWNALSRVRVAVSIDGLQPEHDARRAPATYDRILKSLQGRKADVSWVVTNQMLQRPGYLDEYLAFWTSRTQIDRIWLSIYTPQRGERSEERAALVSRRLGVTRQAVYRTTRELQDLDVLVLESDPQRRNQKIIRKTPRGLHVVSVARACLDAVEAAIRDRIGQHDFNRLARILSRDWGPVVNAAVSQ